MQEVCLELRKINTNHVDEVRKTLDELFDNVRTKEELNELRYTIDDYLDEGYMVKSYVFKYNSLLHKIQEGN